MMLYYTPLDEDTGRERASRERGVGGRILFLLFLTNGDEDKKAPFWFVRSAVKTYEQGKRRERGRQSPFMGTIYPIHPILSIYLLPLAGSRVGVGGWKGREERRWDERHDGTGEKG